MTRDDVAKLVAQDVKAILKKHNDTIMEERDDYPIIPQPEKKTDEFRLQNYRAMENRLLSANSDIKNLKEELASFKEENARLKESIKDLLPIVEFFTVSHLKDGEIWMNRDEVINRAKTLLR